jgi:RES domain-containing protein
MAKRDESAFSKKIHRVGKTVRNEPRAEERGNKSHPPINLFKATLERVPQRGLSGQWLQMVSPDVEQAVQSLMDHTRRGGRWSPPGLFPTVYAAEDDPGTRADVNRWLQGGDGTPFIVLCVEVNLGGVLDLCNPEIRNALGTSVEELTDPTDMAVCRAIGVGAYKAGFQAILYPRPLRTKFRNLAIFPERVAETDLYFTNPHL